MPTAHPGRRNASALDRARRIGIALALLGVGALFAMLTWVDPHRDSARNAEPPLADPASAVRSVEAESARVVAPAAASERAGTTTHTEVRLVDTHTELPLQDTPIVIHRSAPGSEMRLRTSSSGSCSIPTDTVRIAPQDGFSFREVQISELPSPTPLRVFGQYRLRVRSGSGLDAYVAYDRTHEQWREFSDPARRPALEGIVARWTLSSEEWKELPTHSPSVALAVPDATVHPSHAIWAGTSQLDAETGQQQTRPPIGKGRAFVSETFTPQPGASLEFAIILAAANATIEVGLDAAADRSTITLLEVRRIADTESTVTRAVRRSALESTARNAVFDDVPEGDYDVTCAALRSRTLFVSSQRASLRGASLSLTEFTGRGRFTLGIAGSTQGWRIVSIVAVSPEGVSSQVPVEMELSSLDSISGLPYETCRLWLARGEAAGGAMESIEVDLRRTPVLAEFP